MGKFVYRLWLFLYQITGVVAAGALFQFATDGAFDWAWLQQWLLYGVGFSLFVELIELFVRISRRKSIPLPGEAKPEKQTLVKWNASERLAGGQKGKLSLGPDYVALSNAEQTHLIPFTDLQAVERKGHFMPPERELILHTETQTYHIKAWHPSWLDVKGWEADLQVRLDQLPEPEEA